MVKIGKVVCAVLVIYTAGILTGALALRVASNRPVSSQRTAPNASVPLFPQQRVEMLNRLERQLEFTPEQRARIEAILRESQGRMKTIWEPVAPQAREELRNVRKQIYTQLTPSQQEKFDKIFRGRPMRSPDPLRRKNDVADHALEKKQAP